MDKQLNELINFGETWWGQRWIESMLADKRENKYRRMYRGIAYANQNRISNLLIKKGEIFAQCLGSEKYGSQEYRIKLKFDPLKKEQWDKVIEKMALSSIYEAKLISQEMPADIDDVFQSSGVPLFPPISGDLNATCSCPDKAVPCKHIAALILTLAKLFDYDPFKLIKLRGLEQEELLKAIEIFRTKSSSAEKDKNQENQNIEKDNIKTIEITEEDLENFYFSNPKENVDISFNISKRNQYGELIERIGPLPNVKDINDFIESMKRIYKNASKYANNLVFEVEDKN
ncbi:MAG: hypothetical protein GY870_00550 [archaeon]|nr:hypothetical protein [archaeon]